MRRGGAEGRRQWGLQGSMRGAGRGEGRGISGDADDAAGGEVRGGGWQVCARGGVARAAGGSVLHLYGIY